MSTLNLLPHNAAAYNKIKSKLKSGARSVLYVAGTGTGKTYVTNALLTTVWSGRKVAYVVPTVAIWDYLSGVLDKSANVTMFTYNAFQSEKVITDLLNNYEVVVFDEAHHLGSAIEGAAAVRFIKEFSGITFGLTATPYREDHIDVSIFFEQTVRGLDNYTAIRRGLLPQFEYYICSTSEAANLASQYRIKVDLPSSADIVSSVTKDHTLNKMLAFYSSVYDMMYGIEDLQALFPEHTILTVSYQLGDVRDTIKQLETTDKVILASCDMLLEGLHVPTVDGVLLFRNIQSTVVLQQILGRISNLGSTKSPVVMDFTECAFKLFNKIMSEDYENRKSRSGKSRSRKDVHPVLRLPVTSITSYSIMYMLAALQGDPVYILGHDFHNLRAACRYFGVPLNKLMKVVSHCTSLDEAFTKFLSSKYHVGNKQYNTMTEACSAFRVPVTSVRTAAQHLDVPISLVIEDFVEFPFTVGTMVFENPRDVSEYVGSNIVVTIKQRYTAGSYQTLVACATKSTIKRYKIFNRYYAKLSDFCKPLSLKISDIKKLAHDEDIPVECAAEEICRRSRIVIMDHVFLSQQAIGSRLNIRVLMQKYYQPGMSFESLIIKCLDPKCLHKESIEFGSVVYRNLKMLCKDLDVSFLDVLITYHNAGCSIHEAIQFVLDENVVEQWQYDGKAYKSLALMLNVNGINETRFYNYVKENDCTLREAIDVFCKNKTNKCKEKETK